MRNTQNPFVSLNFVKPRRMPNGRGYDFWCPEPVSVTAARSLGKQYALRYILFEAAGVFDGQGAILGFIVEDMFSKGDTGDVAKGFLYTIAETIAHCGMDPEFLDDIRDQLRGDA